MTNPSIALHYFIPFMRPHACPPCAPSVGGISQMFSPRYCNFSPKLRIEGMGSTYQGLLGTVLSVLVVAAELGVDTLERRVTVGLRLLDTVGWKDDISAICCVLSWFLHLERYKVYRPWLEGFILSKISKNPSTSKPQHHKSPFSPGRNINQNQRKKEPCCTHPLR